MDKNSDWADLVQSETGTISAILPLPLLSSATDPRHCSTSCQMHPGDHLRYKTHAGVVEDQSFIVKMPTPLHRFRNRSGRSDIRKLSGGEAKLEVVFQKLNDEKKGIPDDGHRGWKKYGNKSIQNSNHCRGYYKCSAKECRAKKMVQPTDKDPTLFEVTYVNKHSCSSTEQHKRSATATLRTTPADNNPATIEVLEGQGKKKNARMKMEDISTVLTASSVTSAMEDSTRETLWTGILPSKRGRSLVEVLEDKKAKFDSVSYLHTMTKSSSTTTATTSVCEEQGGSAGDAFMDTGVDTGVHTGVDTYLHHSSHHHHQAVYCFQQEPLLWHHFDMDTTLSTGPKSVSMDSDSL